MAILLAFWSVLLLLWLALIVLTRQRNGMALKLTGGLVVVAVAGTVLLWNHYDGFDNCPKPGAGSENRWGTCELPD
jgi:hypothetical protein